MHLEFLIFFSSSEFSLVRRKFVEIAYDLISMNR